LFGTITPGIYERYNKKYTGIPVKEGGEQERREREGYGEGRGTEHQGHIIIYLPIKQHLQEPAAGVMVTRWHLFCLGLRFVGLANADGMEWDGIVYARLDKAAYITCTQIDKMSDSGSLTVNLVEEH